MYAMDDTRLWITGFSYDGLGPGKSLITTRNQSSLTNYRDIEMIETSRIFTEEYSH